VFNTVTVVKFFFIAMISILIRPILADWKIQLYTRRKGARVRKNALPRMLGGTEFAPEFLSIAGYFVSKFYRRVFSVPPSLRGKKFVKFIYDALPEQHPTFWGFLFGIIQRKLNLPLF